jgi:hypothetical protein
MALGNSWPGPSGLTDTTEARKALAGIIAKNTAGVARAGVFPAHTGPLVTARTNMNIDIAAFTAAAVQFGGPVLLANDGVVQLPAVLVSPAAGFNYYVVFAKQNESTSPGTDADNNTRFGVVVSQVSFAAARATLPAGAVELSTIEMPSGKTATNQAGVIITPTHRFTAAEGGVVLVRNQAELDAWTPHDGSEAYRLDTGALKVRNAGAWSSAKAWRFPRTGNVTDQFPAGDFASMAGGSIANALPGDYQIVASVVVSNTALNIAYLRVTAGGVNLSDDQRIDFGGSPQPILLNEVLEDFPGGTLNVSAEVQVAGGTGTVFRAGTGVRVIYLGAS